MMARAATDAAMERRDLIMDDKFIDIRLRREKNHQQDREQRIIRTPTDAVRGLRTALTTYLTAQTAAYAQAGLPPPRPTASMWRLPGEAATSPSAACTAYLREVCAVFGYKQPPGGFYSAHSLRQGPASACNAINVPLPVTRYRGGWSRTSGVVNHYIDPTVVACPAAYHFFGWLLPAARPPPPLPKIVVVVDDEEHRTTASP